MSLARFFGKGIWQTGALLRTVSVHMLAIVQMERRGQSLGISSADRTVRINRDAQGRALRYRRVKVAGIDDAIAANHAHVDHSVPQQKYEC
jgi:hypothetical protein